MSHVMKLQSGSKCNMDKVEQEKKLKTTGIHGTC